MNYIKYYIKELFPIIDRIRLIRRQMFWRKHNHHNKTILYCNKYKTIRNIRVGIGTVGEITVVSYGNSRESLIIGNYCSIAATAKILLSGEHPLYNLSTYAFGIIEAKQGESLCKGPIVIEDDVWVANNVTILSGVTIGKGAVIGAGAVVVKDIPAYAIAGGIPARVIGYRFEKEVCDRLIKLDFSKIDKEFIMNNLNILDKKLDENSLSIFEQLLGAT